jgi:hypothetical protein
MRYEKYDAWKVSHTLALEVYQTTEQWPKSEPPNGNGWTRCGIAPASWYGGFTGGPSSEPDHAP